MSSRTYKIVLIVLIVWFTLGTAVTLIFSDERVLFWDAFVGAVGWLAFAAVAIYKTVTIKDNIV